MKNEHIRVLLVEDNPGDARLIREMLREATSTPFELECADRLSSGLEHLTHGGIDVVLLDLGLPDSQGLETFVKAQAKAPQVPIIVLTGLSDETMAANAVARGAQDYLVKGQAASNLLVRAIRYAMERQRLLADLQRSNAELATSRAFLAGILDSTVDAILTIDEDGVIHSVNKGTTILLDCDEHDLLGANLSDFLSEPYRTELSGSLGCRFGEEKEELE